jgi:uncharacterized protein (TIGR02145 family)
MNYDDALGACPAGNHLPSALELAQISQSLGSSLSYQDSINTEGQYLVSATNPDKTRDRFYFNYKGYYHRPKGDLGNFWFWSSSVFTDNTDQVWVLYGVDGGVTVDNGTVSYPSQLAVLCVRDQ